jgi:hypothetical protein
MDAVACQQATRASNAANEVGPTRSGCRPWPAQVAELVGGAPFVTREVDSDTGQVVSSALRVYDLRHTCASLLIAQDASVKAVQARRGPAVVNLAGTAGG